MEIMKLGGMGLLRVFCIGDVFVFGPTNGREKNIQFFRPRITLFLISFITRRIFFLISFYTNPVNMRHIINENIIKSTICIKSFKCKCFIGVFN